MHAAAYKMFGMDWTYVAFPAPPDRLDAAVKAIRGLGLVGVNVTIPY
ncbi:shikimate dehydrogenase, partial [bacterium]|nr:shikimate dehydrogenase [bacterium]